MAAMMLRTMQLMAGQKPSDSLHLPKTWRIFGHAMRRSLPKVPLLFP